MTKKLLIMTIYLSLLIQAVSGLIGLYGLTIPLNKNDEVLHDILLLETIVQFIEGTWYILIALAVKTLDNNIITKRRYIDWVITTPLMLISTCLFMIYKKESQPKPTKEIIFENRYEFTMITIYNFFMLLFGYLAESNILKKSIAIPIGFIFFGLSFYIIWSKYARFTNFGSNIFYLLFFVWALYGLAATLPVLSKNIMYNSLDIVSKNFYGLFIFYTIITI